MSVSVSYNVKWKTDIFRKISEYRKMQEYLFLVRNGKNNFSIDVAFGGDSLCTSICN